MKSRLEYLGIVDKNNKIHYVKFTAGVNVITGKSSTGKSALIEIFDYCFGNSENTIPVGVITDSAYIYFIIISIRDVFLVLGRNITNKKGFLKLESFCPQIEQITKEYFEENFFLPLKDFKETLGRYFGINIQDTDTDLEIRSRREHNAKASRPTIRNFTSFMLQHQNLIANKHSLFYRFDEKEKREQTIEQFKIFTGFITQDYFILLQEKNQLEQKLKLLRNQQKEIIESQKNNKIELDKLMNQYYIITGQKLIETDGQSLFSDPANGLAFLDNHQIEVDVNSNSYLEELKRLEIKQSKLIGESRNKNIILQDIRSSITYAENHKKDLLNISTISEIKLLNSSKCPFCSKKNDKLNNTANKLEIAINWLNAELKKTPLLQDSFLTNEKSLRSEIAIIDNELNAVTNEIENIKKNVLLLKENRTIWELAQKIKMKIENIIEVKLNENKSNISHEIDEIQETINDYNSKIWLNYNLENKMEMAEDYINETMRSFGDKLEFEETFRPINLKFSLETFELYHLTENKTKIPLRAMGSGSNWLYCHITLFVSLLKYFCSLGEQSLIPPILFFDQPSQVYFPSIIDINSEFDPQQLKTLEGKQSQTDEDLMAVTNLYNQLVAFCKETERETGIIPQIIITDHADNLKLEGVEFEDLVKDRRWRKKGFISNE